MTKTMIVFTVLFTSFIYAGERGGGSGNRRPPNIQDQPAAEVAESSGIVQLELIPTVEITQTNNTANDTNEQNSIDEMVKMFSLETEEKTDIIFIQCTNISSNAMRKILETFITPAGQIASSEDSSIIVINDVVSNLGKIEQIAKRVDVAVPQVLVQAQIVEINLDKGFDRDLKIYRATYENTHSERTRTSSNTNNTTTKTDNPILGSLVSQIAGTNFISDASTGINMNFANFTANNIGVITGFIQFMETKGRAKLLSAPNLILRRGIEGSIVTGEEVPITQSTIVSGSTSLTTVYKKIGIMLYVTPEMIVGDRVRLKINPEVSAVTGSSGTAPTIAVRRAQTTLDIQDGQLISIGGLFRTENREIKRQIPIVGSIPVIGGLFRGVKTESVRTQVIIFLTVKILHSEMMESEFIFRPETTLPAVQAEINRMHYMDHQKSNVISDIKKSSGNADY